MFERYTEKARRTLFFARYEASQFGQPQIETEHLLLGLLREDRALSATFLRSNATVESIRKQIESHTAIREKISTSVDLPLSAACKRAMAYAAEESERFGDQHIGTEHLVLGLLWEEGCFARQILMERGLSLEKLRSELAKKPAAHGKATERRDTIRGNTSLYTDLTQEAANGALESVVGRDLEVETVIEVLCRKERRNPILLGERGIGKSSIVHALAQRIAENKVPISLADKRVLALSPEALSAWGPSRERFGELAKMLGTAAESEDLIVFVEGPPDSLGMAKTALGRELNAVMRFVSQDATTMCIAAMTESEYAAACAIHPGLDKLFRPLHVKPLNCEQALNALRIRKEKLEQFHEVIFSEEALECAVASANSYSAERYLPGKALELLDAAAVDVKIRHDGSLAPKLLRACKARLKQIVRRIHEAVKIKGQRTQNLTSKKSVKNAKRLPSLRRNIGSGIGAAQS